MIADSINPVDVEDNVTNAFSRIFSCSRPLPSSIVEGVGSVFVGSVTD